MEACRAEHRFVEVSPLLGTLLYCVCVCVCVCVFVLPGAYEPLKTATLAAHLLLVLHNKSMNHNSLSCKQRVGLDV